MKLEGILSAKSKRETWERNNDRKPPEPEQPVSLHQPQPGPGGLTWCCGYRFTPGAHVLHLEGQLLSSFDGVYATGDGDPWLVAEAARAQEAKTKLHPIHDDPLRRQELIDAYYDGQRRRKSGRRVPGTSDWMTD